jgi:3-methyladenine DNA glycosylase AlkD
MSKLLELQKELKKIADPVRAKNLQWYFKTGKGEYGEGDIFIGITVPKLREMVKKYSNLNIEQLQELIKSKIHEERLLALLILVNKYETTNHKKICFHFYIKNLQHINNWDLIDLSAPEIIGTHLLNNDQIRIKLGNKNFLASPEQVLEELAKSESVWEKRISIISTFMFIKNNKFDYSLKIAQILLADKHDLIHKAVGWMLREIGKRDLQTEVKFLDKHYEKMPRTMLRYAIEKFPEKQRTMYLKKD